MSIELLQAQGGRWEQYMDFKRVTHVIANNLTKAKVVRCADAHKKHKP